ncbi:MAG TPA: sulfatase [Blastocatellia bacterium]|nr:sulfatase [Blastocatellia bacterium]
MAVWFGILTGLGEVSLFAVKKYIVPQLTPTGSFSFLSQHFTWMIPLAEVILFSIIAIILSLVAWRWPRLVPLRVTAFVFSFLGFFSLLLLVAWFSIYARLALAAGLAVQASYLITSHSNTFYWLVRRTIVWMVALVAMLAAATYGSIALREYRAMAALPPASPDAPNVLLIVLDTVRANNLSLHGYGRPTTPQLERLAKAGARFDRAMATAPWTLPSHASMFTGRYPYELSAGWSQPLDGTYPTLAEALSARGYVTGGFAANPWYCTYESGLERGFARYEDLKVSPGQIILHSSIARMMTGEDWYRKVTGHYEMLGRKSAAEVNGSFLRWQSGIKGRPFFAFLNYFDAHSPYLPPEPFKEMFGPSPADRVPLLWPERKWTAEEVQAEMDAYDGAIAYMDDQIGRLIDELERRSVLDNTLVIITSDHGEEFNEHGFMEHANSLYLASVHVPLVLHFPEKVPANKIIREPSTIRDIPATVIDLLGMDDASSFPGASLARYWDGAADPASLDIYPLISEVGVARDVPEWFPVAKGDMRSLIIDGYRYIKNGDGSEELYDLEADPGEKNNLIDTEHGLRMLNRFRTSLEIIVAHHESQD